LIGHRSPAEEDIDVYGKRIGQGADRMAEYTRINGTLAAEILARGIDLVSKY
jgi:hypothetical protein